MPIESMVQGRITEQMQQITSGYFQIETITFDLNMPGTPFKHATRVSGKLLTEAEEAYDVITKRAKGDGNLIFFRREGEEEVIYAVQATFPAHRANWRLAAILFAATVISVFLFQGLGADFTIDWVSGLSYAVPLMAILLAHELGHFFVARHHHMAVSPPYFIPLPFIGLGTLGAVIAMLAPPKNRRHLLQMGAAGPIAGLILAIPILWYGLSISELGQLPTSGTYLLEGNSLIYQGMKMLLFGQPLPSADGLDVQLHPMAFAGWVGLLVTALNLIPAGQLDGGHAAYTLFGQRIRPLTFVLMALTVVLAFITQFWGWFLWTVLLFFFGQVYAVPMDDITPLDGKHKALAVILLILAILLFIPNPLRAVTMG